MQLLYNSCSLNYTELHIDDSNKVITALVEVRNHTSTFICCSTSYITNPMLQIHHWRHAPQNLECTLLSFRKWQRFPPIAAILMLPWIFYSVAIFPIRIRQRALTAKRYVILADDKLFNFEGLWESLEISLNQIYCTCRSSGSTSSTETNPRHNCIEAVLYEMRG